MFVALFVICALAVAGVRSHGGEVREHVCTHSKYMEPRLEELVKKIESIPLVTHRSANDFFNPSHQHGRTISQANYPRPIRIHVDYQIQNLPSSYQNFMKTDLIPAVQGVFTRMLSVKNTVDGTFYLPYSCISIFPGYPGYCHQVGYECGTARHNTQYFGPGRTCVQPFDDQCTPIPSGPGVRNADFVLYITSRDDAGCLSSAETVASAGFCIYDMDNWYGLPNRPLAGVANFCPSNIFTDPERFGYMLDTAVHEVLHALMFSRQLFDKFIDGKKNLRQNIVVQRDGQLMLRSPEVVKQVRNIMKCSSMDGAKLENEGGYGTAESHWERRLFNREIMVGSSSTASRVVFSNLTLALAADSGWYEPNYGNAGMLTDAGTQGCDFVNGNCAQPNPDLANTFCWDTRSPSSQPAVCTGDYLAVGYCKHDIRLMGDCNVIQAYTNTHCTNVDHYSPTGQVDLGMRNQPGARCFPVHSYKISRTENYYTVYRSGVDATCFLAVCNGNNLYLRIPKTTAFPPRDIACPTGAYIDLTYYGLGYEEGTIGPCPDNKIVCRSWGCPNDCSGHGKCMQWKCYCDLGYVGSDCSQAACPHNPCPSGYICQDMTGLCYKAGSSSESGGRQTHSAVPEYVPGPVPTPGDVPTTPEVTVHSWAPRPATPYMPPEKPETPVEVTAGSLAPDPTAPPGRPQANGTVPFTDPETTPRKPIPPASPAIETAPTRDDPGIFGVPSYDPVPGSSPDAASGRAIGAGFLAGCLFFEGGYGELRVRRDTVRRYTGAYGEWVLEPFPEEPFLAVDPSFEDCSDSFTGLRPPWRQRGFRTVRTLSGISTLVAFSPNALASQSATFQNDETEYNAYALQSEMLTAVGLSDPYILQRDFVTEAWSTDDVEARKAVAYNAMISNTAIQIACFADVSTSPSYRISDEVFRVMADHLENGIPLEKLIYADTVYLIVEDVMTAVSNGRNPWLLSESIATLNDIALAHVAELTGPEILQSVAGVTIAAQRELCAKAVDLQTGEMSWEAYRDETTKTRLEDLLSTIEIPNIEAIMRNSSVRPNTKSNSETVFGIPYIDSTVKESIFAGVLVLFVVLVAVPLLRKKRQGKAEGTEVSTPLVS